MRCYLGLGMGLRGLLELEVRVGRLQGPRLSEGGEFGRGGGDQLREWRY